MTASSLCQFAPNKLAVGDQPPHTFGMESLLNYIHGGKGQSTLLLVEIKDPSVSAVTTLVLGVI